MKLCLACEKNFSSGDWQCPFCGKGPGRVEGFPSFAPELSEENANYPSDGFERLAPLEEKSFWFQARNELIVWAVGRYFRPEGKFLEIGCGTGFVLSRIEREFPKLECFGSEIYGSGLRHSSKRLKRTELLQMDARRIPFREEFDVIGLFDTLEHIPDDQGVLDQVHRALAPGGGVMITVPQHAFLWSYLDEYTHHARRYDRKDLARKLEKSGFTLTVATSFVSVLLPLMWLSRLGQEKPKDFDPEAEFKIHPWLNRLLEQILAAERALIRAGVRFPWGGSLLIIARKV